MKFHKIFGNQRILLSGVNYIRIITILWLIFRGPCPTPYKFINWRFCIKRFHIYNFISYEIIKEYCFIWNIIIRSLRMEICRKNAFRELLTTNFILNDLIFVWGNDMKNLSWNMSTNIFIVSFNIFVLFSG